MMTPEMREQYQKAAQNLEAHARTPKLGNIGMKAYRIAFRTGLTQDEVDNRAARLLRECIAKSEPLP